MNFQAQIAEIEWVGQILHYFQNIFYYVAAVSDQFCRLFARLVGGEVNFRLKITVGVQ